MRQGIRVVLAAAAGLLAGGGGFATARDTRPPAQGPGLVTVPLVIQHSRFGTDKIRVRAGTTVRFVVRNGDPINHELVVGDRSVHLAHQRGSEAQHPPVPGEVSVPAFDQGLTFYRFDQPGTFEFACHLPGHFAYGMRGTVVVERA
jgi:uncharacterized cupredoxin-like copper-binding protein